jgi:hypothetical protein
MDRKGENGNPQSEAVAASTAKQRRALLKRLGRFAAVSAPTVTLLLAASAKPGAVQAASCAPQESSRAFKTRMGTVDGDAVLAAVKSLPIRRLA